MIAKKVCIFIFMITSVTSCSLSPFSPNNTGKSYGAGQLQAETGNVNSNYHIKFGYGVTQDFDAGFIMEFGAISTSAIFFRYSLINNEIGPSFGTEFGYGSTDTTKFYYIGATGSLSFSKDFELFMNPRINIVSTDEADIEKDSYNGNLKILAYDTTYLQFSYGFNVWFSEAAGLSLYSVYLKGNDIETLQDNIFGASFLFNL
jgi:hypothetical protein